MSDSYSKSIIKTSETDIWKGIRRPYTAEDVVALRGSLVPDNTLATRGEARLWQLLNGGTRKGYVNSLGTLSDGQAVQQAKAGIEAIYLSVGLAGCGR